MPKAQDIHGARPGQEFIDDAIGAVDDFPNTGIIDLRNNSSDLGEWPKGKGPVNQEIRESDGTVRAITSDKSDDASKIFLGLRRQDDWVAHTWTSDLAS